MDRRVDVRHFVHRRSCDISSSNMAAYERWPRVSGRGTKYSSEVCRMHTDNNLPTEEYIYLRINNYYFRLIKQYRRINLCLEKY